MIVDNLLSRPLGPLSEDVEPHYYVTVDQTPDESVISCFVACSIRLSLRS
jgi:hypothetical protein